MRLGRPGSSVLAAPARNPSVSRRFPFRQTMSLGYINADIGP